MSRMSRKGNQLTQRELLHGPVRSRTWDIEVQDFGYAPTKVTMGDLDGSGEAPGVQLEFEHIGCPGGAGIAMSGGEAELVARALVQAASHIKPHERLRVRRRRWRRETQVTQPSRPAAIDTVSLGSTEEAGALAAVLRELDDDDPRKRVLADVILQLEIPF